MINRLLGIALVVAAVAWLGVGLLTWYDDAIPAIMTTGIIIVLLLSLMRRTHRIR